MLHSNFDPQQNRHLFGCWFFAESYSPQDPFWTASHSGITPPSSPNIFAPTGNASSSLAFSCAPASASTCSIPKSCATSSTPHRPTAPSRTSSGRALLFSQSASSVRAYKSSALISAKTWAGAQPTRCATTWRTTASTSTWIFTTSTHPVK